VVVLRVVEVVVVVVVVVVMEVLVVVEVVKVAVVADGRGGSSSGQGHSWEFFWGCPKCTMNFLRQLQHKTTARQS